VPARRVTANEQGFEVTPSWRRLFGQKVGSKTATPPKKVEGWIDPSISMIRLRLMPANWHPTWLTWSSENAGAGEENPLSNSRQMPLDLDTTLETILNKGQQRLLREGNRPQTPDYQGIATQPAQY
jgi:hypothetical protein